MIYLCSYLNSDTSTKLGVPYYPAGYQKKKQLLKLLASRGMNLSVINVIAFSRFKIKTKPFSIFDDNIRVYYPSYTLLFPFNYLINPFITIRHILDNMKADGVTYLISYNAVPESVFPILFLKLIKKKELKYIIQIEDGFQFNSKGIRKLIQQFTFWIGCNIANGFIINSQNFKEILPSKPVMEFKGLYSYDNIFQTTTAKEKNRLYRVLFASTLDGTRGIELLIEFLEKTHSPEIISQFQFIITGPGEISWIKKLEQTILRFREKGGQAEYLGFIPKENLKLEMQNADILLALQNPKLSFSRYCFPSKVFEYLTYNKVIISTKISDVDNLPFDAINLIEYDYKELESILNKLVKNKSIDYYDNSAKLLKEYSVESYGEKLEKFFNRI